jgi:hypothetical protein
MRIPFNMSKSLRTTIRILAAPNARVLLHARPSKEVRAQGMPGAGRNPWPACSKKKQAAVTTGTAKTSGIPCAMVLTLIARSPWGPGFLAPIARRIIIPARLASASGGQDHTLLRPQEPRSSCAPSRPPHPASRVVTIAIRPSCRGGTGALYQRFCILESRNIFLDGA